MCKIISISTSKPIDIKVIHLLGEILARIACSHYKVTRNTGCGHPCGRVITFSVGDRTESVTRIAINKVYFYLGIGVVISSGLSADVNNLILVVDITFDISCGFEWGDDIDADTLCTVVGSQCFKELIVGIDVSMYCICVWFVRHVELCGHHKFFSDCHFLICV